MLKMKNNGINNSTLRVALCGVIAALCLVLMIMTGLIPIGTYAFPCFAGIFISAIVIEYGCKWAWGVYVVASVLSLFLAADKEAVIYFIVLFGYYPILKGVIENKVKKRLFQYMLKFIIFNAAAVASFFAGTFLLSIPAEEYTLFGIYVPWIFLIIGNLFFLLYDFAVSVFIAQYIQRIRGKIFKKNK